MALTIADTVLTFGAPADTYTLEAPLARARFSGVMVACGANPGTFILNDKADGSGNALVTVILKSNCSIMVNPDGGFWINGGCKVNAGNPAGSVMTAYLFEDY